MNTHTCQPTGNVWYECSCGQNWGYESGIWHAISRIKAAGFKIALANQQFKEKEATHRTTEQERKILAKFGGRPPLMAGTPYCGDRVVHGSFFEHTEHDMLNTHNKGYMVVLTQNETTKTYRVFTFWGRYENFDWCPDPHNKAQKVMLIPDPKFRSPTDGKTPAQQGGQVFAFGNPNVDGVGCALWKREALQKMDTIKNLRHKHGYDLKVTF